MPKQIDTEMLEIYRKEAENALLMTESSLKKIKKNPDNLKEIFNLYKAVHTLKSSSFQMGFYSVGYLAHLMNDMLEEIKIKKIKLNDEKIAFLDDFSGTLKKAVNYALKNKEIKFDAKLFDEVENIVGTSERERMKNAELEMQKQIGKKEGDKLFDLYIKTSTKLIKKIDFYLKNIRKDYNKKTVNKIITNLHTLEGNSAQISYYIISYFSSKIKSYLRKILLKNNLKEEEFAYLFDLFGTLKIYFNSIKENKEVFGKELVEKLNIFIKEDYADSEKKLNERLKKNDR